MPYDKVADLPENVKGLPEKLQQMWLHVFNSVYEETKDEDRARKAAWSKVEAAKKASEPYADLFREVFPATFEGTKVKVQVLKTGHWVHPTYGEFDITKGDLARMMANFDGTTRALVVDYDHGTDFAETPEQAKAAGWLKELAIEEVGDQAALWGVFDATPKAADYIRNGEYRFFSPTFTTSFTNKESGEEQGATLLRGALTNNPFIDGMHPAYPMSEGAVAMLEKMIEEAKKPEPKAAPGPVETFTLGEMSASFVEVVLVSEEA